MAPSLEQVPAPEAEPVPTGVEPVPAAEADDETPEPEPTVIVEKDVSEAAALAEELAVGAEVCMLIPVSAADAEALELGTAVDAAAEALAEPPVEALAAEVDAAPTPVYWPLFGAAVADAPPAVADAPAEPEPLET